MRLGVWLAIGAVVAAPPSLDDLWAGNAHFGRIHSFAQNTPGTFDKINAGTRVAVVDGAWHLFGRWDGGKSDKCTGQYIQYSVRSSTDKGATWTAPFFFLVPDGTTTCMYADGSPH